MSITVYARETQLPDGCFLADCAVSGGRLRDYLVSALAAAEGRLCVRIAPVFMDFTLPCLSGIGQTLTLEALKSLRGNTPCHFSEALCTQYFTYLQDDCAHVAFFDSVDTLRQKLQIAEAVGVSMALIEDPALRQQLSP